MELATWLTHTRGVWHPQPFKVLPPDWVASHPEIGRWCRDLAPEELEIFERDPTRHPDCPATLRHWHTESKRLSLVPEHPSLPLTWRPEDTRWVSARKWGQLTRFVGTLVPLLEDIPQVLDWCCGKGHLGRLLAHWTDTRVVGIERQKALCDSGERMATRRGLPVQLEVGDVLSPATLLPPVDRGALIALHACGPLTDAAMAHADQGGARLLAVAPCCLQALGPGGYPARSRAGRAAKLHLERSDLYLAMGEEQVATPKLMRRRRTELAWRSGLDLILREVMGRGAYSSFRSVPRGTWDGDFGDYCQTMDAHYGLGLPPDLDWPNWEARGWARSREARALGLGRAGFRRALEVWVALDRAQALTERGWDVQLGTFCSVQTTPRNLLIVAQR